MQAENSLTSRRVSRRWFIRTGSTIGAVSVLAGANEETSHAAENNTIRLALVGCGGRGRGAVANALSVPDSGRLKLVAMADLFDTKLSASVRLLRKMFGDKVDVPPGRQFHDFDAYRKAIDCLQPGDVALLTAYAYCRPAHFEYAVEKGVHVFMEKSFAPDPAGCRRMLRADAAAKKKKNLKIATGLMCRHSVNRQALIQKIRADELGEIQLLRACHLTGGLHLRRRHSDENEIAYQVRNYPFFLWVSGGLFSEFMIHQVDECCWIKDDWPVSARGVGGRPPGAESSGQNFDSYAVEYTFADGSTALVTSRYLSGCEYDFATYAHGTKRAAQFSGRGHRGTVRIYKDGRVDRDNVSWEASTETGSPHQAEWNVLIDAIRNDRPHNEAQRSVYSNLATIMGRAAVHSGRTVTWEDVMNSDFRFCDDMDDLSFDSEPPTRPDDRGRYPMPTPGQWAEA